MGKSACVLILTIVIYFSAYTQRIKYTGKITEQNGQPVPFATILIRDSNTSAIANSDGIFTLQASEKNILVVSAVNFEAHKITLTLQQNLNIVLTREIKILPEVITTAFGIKREQATTPYSAQVMPLDVINIIPQTNLNDALAGKIAGAQSRSQSGVKLNSQTFIRIRGGLSLGGDAGPAFVVDGTIFTDSYDIDPSIIENVTILKGANETALFGGLANGAIVITTKKGIYGKSGIHITQGIDIDQVGRLPEFQNIYAGGGVLLT
jgi:outer membrane receptor protein involved in Fe transport